MHFVLLNQFYPPDVAPTGVMLEALAEVLVGRGHRVTVVCGGGGAGEASGEEAGGGVRLVRLRARSWGKKSVAGKLLAYSSYYLGVAWYLGQRREKAEVIVALTTPPYLSVLARVGAWWHGGRHAHWVMDLYPDVMVAHGMLAGGGWVDRVLGALGRWGMGGRRAGAVLTLGPDMAERLGRYLGPGRAAAVVPLWGTAGEEAEAGEVAALRARRGWGDGAVVFLYSGNMGLGHRFVEVLEAAFGLVGEVSEGGFRVAFFGGGKRRGEVEVAAAQALGRGLRLEVQDYVPQGELAAHLASGDVHLASLEPGWDGMMVPSKLPGIFAAGRPVIFTGSRTGSMGRWIVESGAGWVVAPGDVAGHVEALRAALDPAERARRGRAARAFGARWFDAQRNVARLADLLEEES